MKQFFTKWRKAGCLSVLIVLMLMEMKGACYASGVNPQKLCYVVSSRNFAHTAQASEEENKIPIHTGRMEIICSTKSLLLKCYFYAHVEPTGAQIYRAKVKANGKNGKFKKIGNCKDFTLEDGPYYTNDCTFIYEDTTVKTGTAYAYKYKVYYGEKGKTPKYTECYSKTETGVAAKRTGEYTCKVIKSTSKKLIVKLTGKSKNNGPLTPYYGITDDRPHDGDLRYKNDGGNQIERELELIKFSYDGKKWYTKGKFAIKGKQSVYLYFEEWIWHTVGWKANNIKITDYQYVQMIFPHVRYNMQGKMDSGNEIYNCPQILCNLSSGTAAADDFRIENYDEDEPDQYKWDEGIFK